MAMAQAVSVGTISPDYISLMDAAQMLRIHAASLRRLITKGVIPAIKVRGVWLLQLVHVQMFRTNYVPLPGKKDPIMLL